MKQEESFQEQDWKYMLSIRDALLHSLCSRINAKAVEILTRASGDPHERYLELYNHIQESDKIIAHCFNAWRRSNIGLSITALRDAGLLQDSHVKNFSDSAREWLSGIQADLP